MVFFCTLKFNNVESKTQKKLENFTIKNFFEIKLNKTKETYIIEIK